MATLKCKMCGGDIIVIEGSSVLECEHCGVMQTVPNVSDEKKGRLFDRANLFRRNSDFDKATILYEDIIGEYPEEAEGYWGLVLCKYGIEYVDDAQTGRKIPTCHRTLTTPIEQDADYLAAIEHATTMAKDTYIAEAREIDRIQKQILSIALREEPYDIFICYKETDEFGLRTDDSGMAQDIYTELIREGYKVFFSRITLKGKSGTEYEPYIYSALSSAKVMLVIGTCYEYFEAVWVKNEWSRFLSMMDGDSPKKTLIPCIKGILADDLPPRLKNLQALNISDVTFFKNLMESISRAIPEKSVKETPARAGSSDNISPMLKRAVIFLSDGDFANADAYCEKVLDIDPENSQAYLFKFMANEKIRKEADIAELKWDLRKNGNFDHALTYAKGAEKDKLTAYLDSAIENMNREIAENEAARQRWLTEGIDRACEQVARGEFDAAAASVRPALEDNTRDERAYMTSILIRNKSKCASELVSRAVDIASDEDYGKLLEFCHPENRDYYTTLRRLCGVCCALRFVGAYVKGDEASTLSWKDRYVQENGEDAVASILFDILSHSSNVHTVGALALRYGDELKKKLRDTIGKYTDLGDSLVSSVVGSMQKL
ncbi:MAG: TIR domain-containing protein, partial [Clostridia bacterium]|nr:TIR domain-containing protein [Clostridia bacterium]